LSQKKPNILLDQQCAIQKACHQSHQNKNVILHEYFNLKIKVMHQSKTQNDSTKFFNQWPNLKNFRGGLNLSRGLNMVGST